MSTPSSKRNTILFLVIAAGALAVDQLLKLLVVMLMEPGQSVTVIPGVLDITYSTNTGAAFGILKGSGQVLFLVALVVVVLTVAWFYYTRHQEGTWSFIALGMVIGGALGNLADRLLRGKVTDFLDLGWWPVFNFADVVIVTGVIIFVVGTALELMKE
ncbi:MAG: signal peptidase II [Actinobacteria bacterium]|nr:signal peptidase II [Actinomycetota bacterium]MCG2819171.1 signal peptidase II [Actinomycetes bacterium]MBU4179559.1 signal peptidase II [Actinomycetota bacterium]MBU4219040.1 signal peptidase II [Actinomycetota bacterium]MBU4359228.1 signal peptidase II [Actinomycetota bacterium]